MIYYNSYKKYLKSYIRNVYIYLFGFRFQNISDFNEILINKIYVYYRLHVLYICLCKSLKILF